VLGLHWVYILIGIVLINNCCTLPGNVEYHHGRGETTGNTRFTFKVTDPEGNDLIDQEFYITVMGRWT